MREGGRVPPHNTQAEESLLGAMLLSRMAIEAVLPHVVGADFYTPAHAQIFDAVVGLYKQGAEIDPVTVAAELTRRGVLEDVGGPAALMSLQAATPATTSAKRYALIVSGLRAYRGIIAACGETMALAYDQDGDPADVADGLSRALTEVFSRIVAEEPDDLWVLDEFLDRPIEQRPQWIIPGIARAGWRIMLVAGEGAGKALSLDTPLPSPDGWTTMGAVRVGDRLFAADGTPCLVTFATEVQHDRECFDVVFSDGSVITADADHLWVTQTVDEREDRRPGAPRTTREIRDSLRVRKIRVANHSIPTCGPLEFDHSELPIDPYLLGLWLGDGAKRRALISTADPEIIEAFEDAGYVLEHDGGYDYRISGATKWNRSLSFASALRRLNLLSNKHIPEIYLRGTMKQRIALFQGLMDSDGSITKRGHCEFTVTHEPLSIGFHELAVGLGLRVRTKESAAKLHGQEVSRRWRSSFYPSVEAFRLPRKAVRQRVTTPRSHTRYITDVRPADSVPVRCVQVDSPDHTYLAGKSCIPTHNTVLWRQIGIAAAQGIHPFSFAPIEPVRVLIVDVENPDDSIQDVCQPIREQATQATMFEYDSDRAWLWHRPGGINLRGRRDRGEFEAVIAAVQPDLVCLGPLYKVYSVSANENDEQAAKEVMECFDDLRTRYKFALLLEHHAPKGAGKHRDLMPYGSSLWLRWPELGITMAAATDDMKLMKLGRFRGDRLENSWPTELERGKPWPWVGRWPTGTFNDPKGPPPEWRPPAPPEDDYPPPF